MSPTVAGFTGEAMYAFSNEAGGFADNRLYSVVGPYKMGEFAAAVAYMKTSNGGLNTTGAASSATTVFTASSRQNIDAELSYTFSNNAMVAFAYSHIDVYNQTNNAYFTTQPVVGSQNSWKFDNFEVNGQYFFEPNFWLAAAYTYTYTFVHVATVTGTSMPKFNQFPSMLDYDLSKRTSVYIQGAYEHLASHTGTQFDNAYIAGSTSGNQTLVRLAMMHKF